MGDWSSPNEESEEQPMSVLGTGAVATPPHPASTPRETPRWLVRLRRALDILNSAGACLLLEPKPEPKPKRSKRR
jgi:hypothetical protein